MSKLLEQSNFRNSDINPCIKESNLVTKCLERNLYDYNKCTLYFENFRQCKKFWKKIVMQRKLSGISPKMPTEEEREKIIKSKVKKTYVPSTSE